MGSAHQLARSFRRREPSHRRDEQPVLPTGAAWTVVVVTIACRSALATMVALLLWGLLPGLVGFQTTTVMSGSMLPRLQVGDAVVVRHVDASQLSPGQVLLFDDPDVPGRLRLHRMVGMEEDGRITTRGDANASPDSATTTVDAVHGAGFLRVPFAGLLGYWYRTGQVLPLVGTGLATALLVAGVRLGRLLEDPEERQRRRHRGVRLPALHRAAAGLAALLVVAGGTAAAPGGASAVYSATTGPAGSAWQTACGDVTRSGLTGAPRFLWGFGGSGTTVTDLSGQGAPGVLAGDATRITCVAGASPYLSVGTGTGGGVAEQSARAYPQTSTVATWFKTSSAGGVLADFGSSNSGPASGMVDRALYMRADGSLAFGGSTVQALNLMGSPLLCTSPAGFADDRWHLVVATWSFASGCTLRVDGVLVDTEQPTLALSVLSGYSGYWRFGYETLNASAWTGATARGYFIGGLDESQAYGSVLSAAEQSAILARGH